MHIIYAFHAFKNLIVSFAQFLPLSNIILWWTKLYWKIIRDQKGRSLCQMISNPGFLGRSKQSRNYISRNTKRKSIAKGKTKIQTTCSSIVIYSSYKVDGTYAHIHQTSNQEVAEAISIASNIIYFDDTFHLLVPYEFLSKRFPEPPEFVFEAAGYHIYFSHLLRSNYQRLLYIKLEKIFWQANSD